jgi:integrase
MAAYAQALKNVPKKRAIRSGSVADAVNGYFRSTTFRNLAPETKRTRRNILLRFSDKHGDKMVATLPAHKVDEMVAEKSETPSAARNFLSTLRAFMAYCIAAKIRATDPTAGVKSAPIKTDGYLTWSEENIRQFEERHPIGTRARLALALLLYTAQRRADVVIMGKQHLRDGAIHIRQSKTGTQLAIPVHPELQTVIDGTEGGDLTFLITGWGKAFTPAGFTNWFRDRCNEAKLQNGLSAHGLRKAACRRLAELGRSANEIAAISGHLTLAEVQRYTKAADQARMAKSAMDAVAVAYPARTKVGNP